MNGELVLADWPADLPFAGARYMYVWAPADLSCQSLSCRVNLSLSVARGGPTRLISSKWPPITSHHLPFASRRRDGVRDGDLGRDRERSGEILLKSDSDTTRTLEYVQTVHEQCTRLSSLGFRFERAIVIRIVDHLATFTCFDYSHR